MKTLIIEGPDGCGKSTLAKRLGYELRRPVKTFGSGLTTRADIMKFLKEQQHTAQQRYAIFDRCTAMSELVYSRVFQRPLGLSMASVFRSHLLTLCESCVFIRCDTDNPVHEKSPHDTDEFYDAVNTRLHAIQRAYDDVFVTSPYLAELTIQYDFQKHSVGDVLNAVYDKEHNR